MNRIALFTMVATVALVISPLAGAEWFSYGTYEPDTYLDPQAYMWHSNTLTYQNPGHACEAIEPTPLMPPPCTKGHVSQARVYFNAYPKYDTTPVQRSGAQNGGLINPNAALLHSRLDPAGGWTYTAFLGVWKDCNLDGYVGMAETAAREYSLDTLNAYMTQANAQRTGAGLAALTSPCLPNVIGGGSDWVPGAHVYNSWVTELIPIYGRQYEGGSTDKKAYFHADVMIWGDPGRPDDGVGLRTVSNCHFTGTSFHRHYGHTTGAMLRAIDCEGDRDLLAAWNTAVTAAGRSDLVFDEQSDEGGDHTAPQNPDNQLDMAPFGEDDDWENSMVRVQDCSESRQPIATLPADTISEDERHLWNVPDDNGDGVPDVLNPNGNIAGTWNYTTESVDFLGDDTDDDVGGGDGNTQTSNCDPDDDTGHGFYDTFIETNPALALEGKTAATWNFASLPIARGNVPSRPAGGAGGPTDFGIDPIQWVSCQALCSSATAMPQWGGARFTYTPPLNRAGGEPTDQAEALYWTFYAYTGPLASTKSFALPGGGAANTGTYGAAQCAAVGITNTTGSQFGPAYQNLGNGWDCNQRNWNIRVDGTKLQAVNKRAQVGDPYHLRDVDCWDGTFSAAGIQFAASTTSLRDPGDDEDSNTLKTRCRGWGDNIPSWYQP